MKKMIMFVLVIIFIVSLSFSGTITVNSPNGGESLGSGSNSVISWSGTRLTNPVKITLWKGGIFVGLIVKDQPVNGSYSWTVGNYVGGSASCSSDYKIKIREQGGASFTTEDMSNRGFTITGCSSITVNSPNGGENWRLGGRFEISWSGTGLTNPVKITIWKGGVFVGLIVNDQPANASYIWSVGNYVGGTAIVGSDYRINIREQGGTSFTTQDLSNTDFTIDEAQEVEIYRPNPLRLSNPNGREIWEKNSRKTISWITSGRYLGNIKLLLFKNEREIGIIASDLPFSPYSFSWEVGRHSNGLATAGTDYKIRISSPSNHNIDFSNSNFTIKNRPGTLTPVRPILDINNRINPNLDQVSRIIKLPDLSISNVKMNLQKAGSDRKSNFSFKIKNIGNGNCIKSFKVKIKIHKFFNNDVFYKVANVRPIAAGRDRKIRFQYKFIDCCGFLLTIETDFQNKIIEKSERNNKKEVHINLERN